MRLIIAGGRDLSVRKCVLILDKICPEGITEVVSGGASGGDKAGEVWAEQQGLPVKLFHAAWEDFGKRAGPMRNAEMAQYADACLLLPGGYGTDNMFDWALKEGLRIYDHRTYRE